MYLQYGFTTLPLCQLLFLTLFNSSYFCCFLQAKCFYGHHVVLIKFHVAKFGNFTVNCLVLNIKEMERERMRKRDYMIISITFNFMVQQMRPCFQHWYYIAVSLPYLLLLNKEWGYGSSTVYYLIQIDFSISVTFIVKLCTSYGVIMDFCILDLWKSICSFSHPKLCDLLMWRILNIDCS